MNKQSGGKVFASGGFGCVFKPPLKCKNGNNNSNKISKLMKKKHAEDEYNQIQKYKNMLQVIPNYGNYFLLNDFTLCEPDKLTNDDLKNYGKKCKTLNKKNITKKNINKSLNKLLVINMPNGGIDVEKFVEDYFTAPNIIRLNNSLIDLLLNGIIPMNNLNVYHCDIKDGNVLVQITETGFITRLIDWGLSVVWNETNKGIPRKQYRRPFQFNVPFSSVLFNNEFMKLYNKFLKMNKSPDYFQIREFVLNYIFIWNDIRGSGHLSAINDIVKKLTIKDLPSINQNKVKDHIIEYDFTYYYIVEYLSRILEKYTNNGTINIMEYYKEVFLKNVDIWGFVMIYITLYEYLYDFYDKLNEYQMFFIRRIKYIIIHYLYETPISPIDVSSLVNELTSLNKVIEQFSVNSLSKDLQMVEGGKNRITKRKSRKRRINK